MHTNPLAFSVTVLAVIVAFLGFDAGVTANGQLVIGAATWAFLLVACVPLSAEERNRVALVVLFATMAEVLGSLVLGVYVYRLENLPSFVPPGHGLVYLAGLRISHSAPVLRHGRAFVAGAAAAVAVWGALGLTVLDRPDVLGALAGAGLIYMLLRGPAPALYAGVFVIVACLELYGTAIGAWHWAETVPGTPLGAGDPPSGIASIYVLFDISAITVAPRVRAGISSLRRLPPLARTAGSC